MVKIKNLYDGINFVTIPKVISDELKLHGSIRSSISKRGEDGKFITIYGDFLKPIFATFKYNELNFCINDKHIGHLFKLLDLGLCFDINKNKLNRKNIEVYYTEYSKGFNIGYNDFESTLKNSSSLFSSSNEQISYKIYSRIKQHWTEDKDGAIILNAGDFKINDNVTFLLTKNNFFESGINGGEFYKAWEIILNNPTVFEPIFLKNNEIQNETIEPEAVDLNNTSTTDKPKVKVFDPNHFNNNCHNLFNYLVDNYTKKGKIKFINIYYFLKDEVDKQKYSFNFIQDDYTLFIKEKHQIEIKKYQKAEYDFIEQKRILNSHEEIFRKQ